MHSFPNMPPAEQELLARDLSDPTLFYERYFSEIEQEIDVPTIRRLAETMEREQKRQLDALQMYQEALNHPNADIELVQERLEQARQLCDSLASSQLEKMMEEARHAENMPVSIFLTELEGLPDGSIGRFILGALPLGSRAQFGTLHAGIKIGPFLIDWNNSSLVIPRMDLSQIVNKLRATIPVEDASIFSRLRSIPVLGSAIDLISTIFHYVLSSLATLLSIGSTRREKLHELARTCVLYNREYQYSLHSRNCQIFTEDALRSMDLRLSVPPDSELRSFLDNLRSGWDSRMVFQGEFFCTRQQLHDFAAVRWRGLTESDRVLLRCYEQIFHTRYAGLATRPEAELSRSDREMMADAAPLAQPFDFFQP